MLLRNLSALICFSAVGILLTLSGCSEEAVQEAASEANATTTNETNTVAKAATSAIAAEQAWARATRPSGRVGVAFLQLVNHSDSDDALISVSSPSAGRIELHTHIQEGETMRMMKVERIQLPAHGKASLQPGADHLMLFELDGPLVLGHSLTITLSFESGLRTSTEVIIGAATSASYDEASSAATAAGTTEQVHEETAPTDNNHEHHQH